jgi:hypothetical protein
MKFNKLAAAIIWATSVSGLAQNNIGTLVTDPIRPFSVSSTHPSAIANEIKGGPFTSSNLAGLSNIPAPRLEIGAIGYATNTGLYYRLTATNPAIWSSIDGLNITNLNASNITGSIPFLNISNALTNASVAFGTASFVNQVVFPSGTISIPAARFGGTNLNFGIWQGSAVNFGGWLGISAAGSNIARFQTNRVVFDQPIDFLSSTNSAALTTRTNLGIQDFVTNPVVQVVSGGTGATNAATARTNLGATTIGNSLFTATSAAEARTNIGLTLLALTNTNNTDFRNAIGLGITNVVRFGGIQLYQDGEVSNSITYTVDTLDFNQDGSVFLSLDSSTGGTVIVYRDIEFGGTNSGLNASQTRTNLGLGGANSVVFSNLSLSNGAQTNLALAIGSTNRGFFATSGPERINVVVGGSSIASFFSNSFEVNSQFNVGASATITSNLSVGGPILFIGAGASSNIATTRTNLGLGWPALTNSNAGTSLVSVNTNGEVVSPTNFWQQAPIATTVAFSAPATNSTNTATNSRNLIIQSLSSNIVNTTNTLLLPTNTSTFNGDTAVVIHAGGSNSATAIRQTGQTSNLIVLTNFDHAVRFLYFNNTWDFYHNLAYVEPIYFSGTNASANAATSRTNLGLGATNSVEFNQLRIGGSDQLRIQGTAGNISFYDGIDNESVLTIPSDTDPVVINNQWNDSAVRSNLGLPLPALTNTNNANFQAAVFNTNTTPAGSAFNTIVAWMEVHVFTNGSNTSFRIPLFK